MARSEKKTAKRPGPRPRGPYVGKRKTLTTRITEETRAGLEAAAAASDRSLSQEIEFRLEASFQRDEANLKQWGGAAALRTWLACAAAANAHATKNDKDWLSDHRTLQQVQHSTVTLMDLLGPEGPKIKAASDEDGVEQAVSTFVNHVKSKHGMDLLDPLVLRRLKLREEGFSESIELFDKLI